jgi:uncharacterized membrane protein YfcA
MLASQLPLFTRLSIYLAAGIGAGIANGVAGGGSFVTFPTLIATGISALQANISTTVGVLPSYVGGIAGFRRQIGTHRSLIVSLVPSCVVGAGTGCTLLLVGSSSTFRHVVPWLIGAGTVLFALAPLVTKGLEHLEHTYPSRRGMLFVGVFVVSIYGGYFGAGMGILLLAVMAVTLPFELAELQGLRNVISLMINLCAAAVFLVHGHLAWDAIYMLLVGTLIGGWLGTLLIRHLSPQVVRVLIIATGVFTTYHLATTG